MEIILRVIKFIIFNLILMVLLYNVDVNNELLNNICIVKIISGHECWNCGMTRAFLSVIHLNFNSAIQYNKNVIVVFPLTVFLYLTSWIKYIFRKEGTKYE